MILEATGDTHEVLQPDHWRRLRRLLMQEELTLNKMNMLRHNFRGEDSDKTLLKLAKENKHHAKQNSR
jgi:hypothetical protein